MFDVYEESEVISCCWGRCSSHDFR